MRIIDTEQDGNEEVVLMTRLQFVLILEAYKNLNHLNQSLCFILLKKGENTEQSVQYYSWLVGYGLARLL